MKYAVTWKDYKLMVTGSDTTYHVYPFILILLVVFSDQIPPFTASQDALDEISFHHLFQD
jgi:hypothetical protein